jgi:hypothetical protein
MGILGYFNDGKTNRIYEGNMGYVDFWDFRLGNTGLGNLSTLTVGIDDSVECACVLTFFSERSTGWIRRSQKYNSLCECLV